MEIVIFFTFNKSAYYGKNTLKCETNVMCS